MTDRNDRTAGIVILFALWFSVIPLLPRPTFGGVASAATLSAVAIFLALAAVFGLSISSKGRIHIFPGTFNLVFILLLGVAVYGARSVANGDMDELDAVASRAVLVLLVGAFCYIFQHVSPETLIHRYIYGVVLLALLALFISVTGVYFLEAPRPSRELGFSLPLLKTAGVPRSFGEQGIVVAIALSFVLVYWSRLRRLTRFAVITSIVVIEVTGQSRNMLLSLLFVILAWIIVRHGARKATCGVLLLASALSTFLIEQLFPRIIGSNFGSAIVGDGILETNVKSRFELVRAATELIGANPVRALAGWSHKEWVEVAPGSIEATIHNHFVALLIFMGLPIGLLTIWILFVHPLAEVIKNGTHQNMVTDNLSIYAVVAGCGVLSSLNFYEGFFSISLALYTGLIWSMAYRSSGSAVRPQKNKIYEFPSTTRGTHGVE